MSKRLIITLSILILISILIFSMYITKNVYASEWNFSYNILPINDIGANQDIFNYSIPNEIIRYQGATIGKNSKTNPISNSSMTLTFKEDNIPDVIKTLPEVAFVLYSNTTRKDLIEANRERIQRMVDIVSFNGGGEIKLERGVYYINPETNPSNMTVHQFGNLISFCIYVRDNVTISGTLSEDNKISTWLLPYGTYPYACNVFHCIDKVTKNANFYDLGIDHKYYTNTDEYLCHDKGYMIAPMENCNWYNCIVINTGGTGFGVDQPVNCTIKNCTAIGCGKKATNDTDAGASGFGIGYGTYSSNESILVSKCLSLNNRKFGIFFENQYRFKDTIERKYVKSLVAKDCISAGNLYNYGGEYCFGANFYNCQSYETTFEVIGREINNINVKNKEAFHFGVDSGINYIDGESTLQESDPLSNNTGFLEKNGQWYWYTNGIFDTNMTSIKQKPDGTWWRVVNGVIDTSCNSVEQNENGWFYIRNGKVDFGYTGLAQNRNGWWMIQKGKVNFNYYGIVQNQYGWWRVEKGKVNFNSNSVEQNQYGWWKLHGGKVDFGYTGIAQNSNGWWRIERGKVNFNYQGLAQNEYGWFYLKDGKVDFSYNGLASNQYGTWLVINGKVKF